MGPIDPRNEIKCLVSDADRAGKHEMGDLDGRVERIASILQQHAELKSDSEIRGQIWTFLETHKEPIVQKLRSRILFGLANENEHSITLCPADFIRLVTEGAKLPENATVSGNLALSAHKDLKTLPKGLRVEGTLTLAKCENLESLPEDFQARFVVITDCPHLVKIPDGLNFSGDAALSPDLILKSTPPEDKQAFRELLKKLESLPIDQLKELFKEGSLWNKFLNKQTRFLIENKLDKLLSITPTVLVNQFSDILKQGETQKLFRVKVEGLKSCTVKEFDSDSYVVEGRFENGGQFFGSVNRSVFKKLLEKDGLSDSEFLTVTLCLLYEPRAVRLMDFHRCSHHFMSFPEDIRRELLAYSPLFRELMADRLCCSDQDLVAVISRIPDQYVIQPAGEDAYTVFIFLDDGKNVIQTLISKAQYYDIVSRPPDKRPQEVRQDIENLVFNKLVQASDSAPLEDPLLEYKMQQLASGQYEVTFKIDERSYKHTFSKTELLQLIDQPVLSPEEIRFRVTARVFVEKRAQELDRWFTDDHSAVEALNFNGDLHYVLSPSPYARRWLWTVFPDGTIRSVTASDFEIMDMLRNSKITPEAIRDFIVTRYYMLSLEQAGKLCTSDEVLANSLQASDWKVKPVGDNRYVIAVKLADGTLHEHTFPKQEAFKLLTSGKISNGGYFSQLSSKVISANVKQAQDFESRCRAEGLLCMDDDNPIIMLESNPYEKYVVKIKDDSTYVVYFNDHADQNWFITITKSNFLKLIGDPPLSMPNIRLACLEFVYSHGGTGFKWVENSAKLEELLKKHPDWRCAAGRVSDDAYLIGLNIDGKIEKRSFPKDEFFKILSSPRMSADEIEHLLGVGAGSELHRNIAAALKERNSKGLHQLLSDWDSSGKKMSFPWRREILHNAIEAEDPVVVLWVLGKGGNKNLLREALQMAEGLPHSANRASIKEFLHQECLAVAKKTKNWCEPGIVFQEAIGNSSWKVQPLENSRYALGIKDANGQFYQHIFSEEEIYKLIVDQLGKEKQQSYNYALSAIVLGKFMNESMKVESSDTADNLVANRINALRQIEENFPKGAATAGKRAYQALETAHFDTVIGSANRMLHVERTGKWAIAANLKSKVFKTVVGWRKKSSGDKFEIIQKKSDVSVHLTSKYKRPLFTGEIGWLEHAARALHDRAGNCAHRAALAMYHIIKGCFLEKTESIDVDGNKIMKQVVVGIDDSISHLELVSFEDMDHAFLVVNRDQMGTLSDPKTWGEKAFVVDAWLWDKPELRLYPASQAAARMEQIRKLVQVESNSATYPLLTADAVDWWTDNEKNADLNLPPIPIPKPPDFTSDKLPLMARLLLEISRLVETDEDGDKVCLLPDISEFLVVYGDRIAPRAESKEAFKNVLKEIERPGQA